MSKFEVISLSNLNNIIIIISNTICQLLKRIIVDYSSECLDWFTIIIFVLNIKCKLQANQPRNIIFNSCKPAGKKPKMRFFLI